MPLGEIEFKKWRGHSPLPEPNFNAAELTSNAPPVAEVHGASGCSNHRGASGCSSHRGASSCRIIVEPLAVADIEEPPMAYVIEEIPEEPLQETSELFTVPENWDPPSDFRMGAPLHGPENYHGRETAVPPEEGFTCYVEEETPMDMAPQEPGPE
jgi:hypothetical protein